MATLKSAAMTYKSYWGREVQIQIAGLETPMHYEFRLVRRANEVA